MKITHAAVKTPTAIYSQPAPCRHHHVIRLMMQNGHRAFGDEIEGFLDEEGNFLNRQDAYILAVSTGQIDRSDHPPNSYNGTDLYSEDLW